MNFEMFYNNIVVTLNHKDTYSSVVVFLEIDCIGYEKGNIMSQNKSDYRSLSLK